MTKYLLCVGLVLLTACVPTPSRFDAHAVPPKDAASSDNEPSHDAVHSDSLAVDQVNTDVFVADTSVADSSVADTCNDAQSVDTSVADTHIADTHVADSAPFFGPYLATDVPKPIADHTTTVSVINVASVFSAYAVDVDVEIVHWAPTDIEVWLVPPVGMATELFNGDTCLTETCDSSISLQPRLTPVGTTTGAWVLRIVDRAVSVDGTLQRFNLTFIP